MIKKIVDTFHKLLHILNSHQKFGGVIVLSCSLLAALLETIGVSIIIPLVNVLLSPRELYENRWIKLVTEKMNIHEDNQLIILIVCIVILVYILKNAYFVFFCWIKSNYAYKIQRECSTYMMKSYMNRGYRFFLQKNVNELMQGVNGDVQSLYQIISGLLQIISQILIALFIFAYMCYVDYQIAFGIILSALICLILSFVLFRKKMFDAGIKMRDYGIRASQALSQAFYGIKEVIVMRKHKFFIKEFEDNTVKKQRAQTSQAVGVEIPAYMIEGICVSGIMIFLCIRIIDISSPEMFVATMASFAVGAFRILPALGKISSSINTISASMPGFNAVYENVIDSRKYNSNFYNIETEDDNRYSNVKFNSSLKIRDVVFSYNSNQENVLEGVNFEIQKGKSVAFVGESGAGKSTLADLILGVLTPNQGKILLDNIEIQKIPNAWSRIIGYVPQSIYLSDASICENIAFGIERQRIDKNRVKDAIEKAELLDFVNNLPDGIYTIVGERGVRLSGGQRQRIGIARALYHNPEILILDEATSALDNETEKAVMQSIDSLHGTMTLIIIAHRLTTIKKCDVIYEVKNGKIIERKYDDLI